MATAAELQSIDPDLADALRQRIESAGWKVAKLLNVIGPFRDEDSEVVFLGQKAGTRSGGKEHAPHTAFVPQDPDGDVVVVDGFL